MVLTLKKFCEETGFPRKMVKQLANAGTLPHWRRGRTYLFDREKTMATLTMLQAQPLSVSVSEPLTHLPRRRRSNVIALPGSRTQQLKELRKQKAALPAGTGKAAARK